MVRIGDFLPILLIHYRSQLYHGNYHPNQILFVRSAFPLWLNFYHADNILHASLIPSLSVVGMPAALPALHTQFICRRYDNGKAIGTPTPEKK